MSSSMSCTHHQHYKDDQIKENNMDGAGRSHGREEKWIVGREKPDKKKISWKNKSQMVGY